MSTLFATPRARALGFGLRTVREARGYGVRELARRADVNPQDLSKWEYGKRVPKIEDVAVILGVLQVEPEERERLLELARTAREPSWLERSMSGVPPLVSVYAEYERTATAMFGWEQRLIPGLFQTDDYARVVLAGHGLRADQIDKLIFVRMARRGVLTRAEPLTYQVVVDECALRPSITGPAVMLGQLRHLLVVSERTNVRLQVLPTGGGFHPGLYGSFAILEFPDLPPIVFLEQYRAAAYLYDEDQVAEYKAAAATLAALALSEQGSRALIGEVIAELGGTA